MNRKRWRREAYDRSWSANATQVIDPNAPPGYAYVGTRDGSITFHSLAERDLYFEKWASHERGSDAPQDYERYTAARAELRRIQRAARKRAGAKRAKAAERAARKGERQARRKGRAK